jgi:hypothetical protein
MQSKATWLVVILTASGDSIAAVQPMVFVFCLVTIQRYVSLEILNLF